MKKEISLRELILLGILIIIAAYYFLIYGPVTNELSEIETNRSIAETELSMLEAKLGHQRAMEAEIAKVSAESGGNPTPIPDFDNANNIINELHVILGSRDIPYNIKFNKDNPESFVLRRDLDITFTSHNYDEALSILKDLKSSPFRYTIDDIIISDSTVTSETGTCAVSLNIFCYEYTGEESNK